MSNEIDFMLQIVGELRVTIGECNGKDRVVESAIHQEDGYDPQTRHLLAI